MANQFCDCNLKSPNGCGWKATVVSVGALLPHVSSTSMETKETDRLRMPRAIVWETRETRSRFSPHRYRGALSARRVIRDARARISPFCSALVRRKPHRILLPIAPAARISSGGIYRIIIHGCARSYLRRADAKAAHYVGHKLRMRFRPRTTGDREHNSEIVSPLRSRLPSLTRMTSCSAEMRGNTSARRRHNSPTEASPL
jgi:hypothetical protein